MENPRYRFVKSYPRLTFETQNGLTNHKPRRVLKEFFSVIRNFVISHILSTYFEHHPGRCGFFLQKEHPGAPRAAHVNEEDKTSHREGIIID